MKVKCPKCGWEFEVEPTPMISVPSDQSMALGLLPHPITNIMPWKEIHLSCGHIIRCEFAQFHKGQKTWCPDCKKEVEVVKCVDAVTGEEYDML